MVVLLPAAGLSVGCSHAAGDEPARQLLPQQAVHHASGVVRRIAREIGALVVDHGPVPSLNWPAMRMTFVVDDRALLDILEEGDAVQFNFQQSGERYVVRNLERAELYP